MRISITTDGPRMQLSLVLPMKLKQRILTGTFILKSSLLNLKARSERVLWKNPVGRRTRTSWRFAGKEACKRTERLWHRLRTAGAELRVPTHLQLTAQAGRGRASLGVQVFSRHQHRTTIQRR